MGTDDAISERHWEQLSRLAWETRDRAHVHGPSRVGAAVLSEQGGCFPGCNVEHQYRSHDVHAEVNALATMVAAGHTRARAILIASERERFTPCGGCLDWIFELGGPSCMVAFEPSPSSRAVTYRADELLPFYPR
jgi:cytidine deaminase